MYFEKNKKLFENEDTIFGSILVGDVKANLWKLFIKKDKFFGPKNYDKKPFLV
jgi:hypothetical protein